MPHRSRLALLLLDLPPESHDAGRNFWAGATGRPAETDDVEADDVEAEVARLEALGARKRADMGGYWQLTDPAGLVFCVVGIQTGEEFDRHATTWPRAIPASPGRASPRRWPGRRPP